MREMTKEEKMWSRRFQRCLREMPRSLEVSVHHGGSVLLHERNAAAAYFERVGNVDNVPELDYFQVDHLRPCSESI